jgi:hypothetical protein
MLPSWSRVVGGVGVGGSSSVGLPWFVIGGRYVQDHSIGGLICRAGIVTNGNRFERAVVTIFANVGKCHAVFPESKLEGFLK